MTVFPPRLRRWLAALALAAGLPAAAPAPAAIVGELPPVDSVFVLSARATAPNRIEVRWKIAEGYYLYRHRTSVQARAGFTDAVLALPNGDRHHDEFFGDVETYRHQLVGVLSGTPAPGTQAVALTVKYQGCADAGVCYPPQTRTLSVALPAADDAGAKAGTDGAPLLGRAGRRGLLALDAAPGAQEAPPLPPEQAFTSEVIALDGNTLLLRLTPARGYYLYRDKLSVRLEGAAGLSTALPQGVFRVTRHPMMFAIALWGISHLIVAPSLRSLLLNGGLALMAVGGARTQDAKFQALYDKEWRIWSRRSPFWPTSSGRGWCAISG